MELKEIGTVDSDIKKFSEVRHLSRGWTDDMCVIKLLDFSTEDGTVTVKGLDAIDGTPIIDIKPYMPHFDSYPEATVPEWLKKHVKKYHD